MLKQSIASLVLVAALIACGSSREDVRAEVERAAQDCIRVGERLSAAVVSCLQKPKKGGALTGNPNSEGSPMRRCLPARGTIGMFCGYLNLELDSRRIVSKWNVSVSQEE